MSVSSKITFLNTEPEKFFSLIEKFLNVSPEIINPVKSSWEKVQTNIGKFQRLFGQSNFIIIDNNKSNNGFITCIYCGLVNDKIISDNPEWRWFGSFDNRNTNALNRSILKLSCLELTLEV